MSELGAGPGPPVGDAPWKVRSRCHSCLSLRNGEQRRRKGERKEEEEVRQEKRKKGKGGIGNTREKKETKWQESNK